MDNAHVNVLQISKPYISSSFITRKLKSLHNTKESKQQTIINLAACNYLIVTGRFMQFPIKTIATAMKLYHKFHLFHPLTEVPYQEIAAACLFVACKIENTYKKLKEILIGAYKARHPDKPQINPTSQTLEDQRKRVNGLERMILETIAFDFRQKHPFHHIVKICKTLQLSRHEAQVAWTIGLDAYRTFAPLKVESQAIACAAVAIASKIFHNKVIDFSAFLEYTNHVDEAVIDVLDLYTHFRSSCSIDDQVSSHIDFISIQIDLQKRKPEPYFENTETTSNTSARKFKSDKGFIRFFLDSDQQKRDYEVARLLAKNKQVILDLN